MIWCLAFFVTSWIQNPVLFCHVSTQPGAAQNVPELTYLSNEAGEDLLSIGCSESIFLDAPYIVPNSYQASIEIIASGILLNGQTVFQAGEEVILDAGFEVQTGAVLEVVIAPCDF